MAMASQSEEGQFAHLLQPIRDLAANWDIDVASELEDYLETLDNLTFSFDGGPTLNFAQAALVIQGSAGVYSRKVEYLHSLVYQALDCVAERRKRGAQEKTQSQTEDETEFSDEEERFLKLDDILEEGTGIDMEEGQRGTRTPLNRVPGALLALEEKGRGEGNGDAGYFQLGRCSIHRSGALLLEPRDGAYLDEFLRRTNADAIPDRDVPEGQATGETQPPGSSVSDGAADFPMGDRDSHEDDPGPSAYWGDDAQPMEDSRGQAGEAAEDPAWLDGAAEPAQEPREAPGEEQQEPAWDPYTPLDPHEPGSLPIAPYRKACKRRGRPKQKQKQVQLPSNAGSILASLLGAHGFVAGGKLRLPEFGYARQAVKPASKPSVRSRQPAAVVSAFTKAEATASEQQEVDEQNGNQPEDFGPGEGIHSDDDDGGSYGGDGPAGFGNEEYGIEAGGVAGDEPAPPFWAPPGLDGNQALMLGPDSSYEDLCRAHIEAFISAAAAAETQTALGARVSDWRTKIGPILDEQAEREEFDTQAVGTALLYRMQQLSLVESESVPEAAQVPNLDFGEVAAQASRWEVARNFSAMLQLVNAGNVGMERGPWVPAASASAHHAMGHAFRLQLLCLAPAHQRLQGFLAPSLAALQQGEGGSGDAAAQVEGPPSASPLRQLNKSQGDIASRQAEKAQQVKRRRTAVKQ